MGLKGITVLQGSKITVALLVSVLSVGAWAFSFMIGESQLNTVLGLTFPYETRMGESHVTLSDPKPHFYESSQQIGITLNIALKDMTSGKTAKAKTLIKGGIRFDNKAQQLHLVKPKIASLDWDGASPEANKDLVKQVSQLVGQDLPVIVLLDIKQLTGSAFTPVLSDIKVKQAGIEVIF
ncbi:hypothetical protein [Alkalimarinus sediminis]|uniref:Uncharacterized protein n=1 Tax=Alkalimarinus sediminis TaxID=1632866 RepID=A0A9E8KPL1_9ALTE|nr:hypothetical protein [Alkalimarinus sediminis]UZW73627.1 hypothetical protein NNL22_11320 [Alkalimarinus sediminis]